MTAPQPLVSVLIPVYNGGEFLAATIESVLKQTYRNFELVLVNDASSDDSEKVIESFSDPRIRYIPHPTNRGAQIARKTALEAAKGELISYLDQDDLFHPEKLEAHVDLLNRAPDIGLSYNGHFLFQGSPENIRGLHRPPNNVALADLVLGFPISPSDIVVRKDWAVEAGRIPGSRKVFHGGEILIYGKLFLEGCRFACVDRPLNYRRAHAGRRVRDLEGNYQGYLAAQQSILDDPLCPPELQSLRSSASALACVVWACYALAQGETDLGRKLTLEAIRLTPELLRETPSELAARFVDFSLDDDSKDHEDVLRTIFAHLPDELSKLQSELDWAIRRGCVLKGASASVWGGDDQATVSFRRAATHDPQLDESAMLAIGRQLLDYEYVYGEAAAAVAIDALAQRLEAGGFRSCGRRLKALHSMNRAFRDFEGRRFDRVPEQAVSAMARRPEYMLDRGVWSISLRSLTGMLRRRLGGNVASNV